MLKKNDIEVKTKCYYKINLIVTAIVLMLGLMSEGVSEEVNELENTIIIRRIPDAKAFLTMQDRGPF